MKRTGEARVCCLHVCSKNDWCQQRLPSGSERQLARQGNRVQALKQVLRFFEGFLSFWEKADGKNFL